ncbi:MULTISPECIES: PP2C family protein-serine/threonine phosphatase [unclassified Nocardioides]|uniref:PP2C family protein-serine/threonine phosphatase n=1 Tax=unclassified Nocardioides TaxID=2615069 RepID=UPI003606C2DA
MLRFSGAGVSDVGRVRPHNEDAAFLGPYVAIVADGVGGAAAGEVASATSAYVVAATALAHFGEDPGQVLVRGVEEAHASVRAGVVADPERTGMATTLTAVATDGYRAVLAHVGDSRAYLLRDGDLRQLSRDHTYVQHLVDSGQLDADARAGHPWSNVVLRSLDGGPESSLDLTELDLQVGDRLLLCSDGLTDLVPELEIAEALKGLADPHAAASILVHAANTAGGRDNVTCLVLDVEIGPLVIGDGTVLGALADPTNIVDPASVHA